MVRFKSYLFDLDLELEYFKKKKYIQGLEIPKVMIKAKMKE